MSSMFFYFYSSQTSLIQFPVTQTYFLAHSARGKLSSEASRGDHNLRLLVGHANLLDALTVELQEAEKEQEVWFDQTVKASRKQDEPKRVQWRDAVAAEQQLNAINESDLESDSTSESGSDSDSDVEEDDFYAGFKQADFGSTAVGTPYAKWHNEEADDYDDEDESNNDLALTRTQSHSSHPPELVHDHDSSDDSDEEISPVSPIHSTSDFLRPHDELIKTIDFALGQNLAKAPLLENGFYLPEKQAPLVAAY